MDHAEHAFNDMHDHDLIQEKDTFTFNNKLPCIRDVPLVVFSESVEGNKPCRTCTVIH